MSDPDVKTELARIVTRLDHIDRALIVVPSLTERVTRIEAKGQTQSNLTQAVEDNKIASAVATALEHEREKSAAATRANLTLAATIAGVVSAALVTLMSWVITGAVQ